MSGSVKLGLYLLLAVVAVYVGLMLIKPLMTIAILAGVGLVVYGLVSRKALSGGRRTLP